MKNSILLIVIAIVALSCHPTNYKNGYDLSPYQEFLESSGGRDGEELENFNTEEYDAIVENEFLEVMKNPLSTFSIDVDGASYSNVRRFIQSGNLPPKDAVRLEEFVNYFDYEYTEPKDNQPFSIQTELSECPWNPDNQLLHIGIQGKKIDAKDWPENNLVFLLDVSGSMNVPNKLPLLKSSLKMLMNELSEKDYVSIVVYAGASGLVLQPTSCENKSTIIDALEKLEAGGSTAGGEGIKLAYKTAMENFKPEANNRIILATDGDFNIGVSSNAEMKRLIEEKRKSGVYLSVLGFGMGNYKDSKMEILADQGNGNYYYIDNLYEAKKVLVDEMGGTLVTIAKDVKIQMEFNPTKVKEYRLIGYENRLMKHEDFENDEKDAGEIGAGHTVTALYEIVPAHKNETKGSQVNYQYQNTQINPEAYKTNDLAYLKIRYKDPDKNSSKLLEVAINDRTKNLSSTSDSFQFSAAVVEYGLLLRDSNFKGNSSYNSVLELAKKAKGKDEKGYRAEFIKLVELTKSL